MPDQRLTTYAEILGVLDHLAIILRETRRARRLSIRAAARQIGCSFATISRVEAGGDCVLSNALAILRWIDRDQEPDR